LDENTIDCEKEVKLLGVTIDCQLQLLAHGRWFSPGTPASATTKTGRHDIAEILLKVALKHQKSINQSIIYLRYESFVRSSDLTH
jgi:hypothetical protein